MISVLDNFLKDAQLYFYGIAILIALFRYSKYYDTPLKFFPILLMYTFLNELLGYLIHNDPGFFNPLLEGVYNKNNLAFYNLYNIIFYLYFLYIFWHFIQSIIYKKWIKILASIFILVSFLNLFFQDFLIEAQVYAYTYGGLSIIFSIFLFLKDNNEILIRKIAKQSLLFWISIGLLVFYLFYIPIKIYYSVTTFENMELYRNIRRIHLSAICLMYSFIIYGFIQMKGKLKI